MNPHEAGLANKRHVRIAQCGIDGCVECLARFECLVGNDRGRNVRVFRNLKACGVGAVRNHQH
jgi:hypothetical protein